MNRGNRFPVVSDQRADFESLSHDCLPICERCEGTGEIGGCSDGMDWERRVSGVRWEGDQVKLPMERRLFEDGHRYVPSDEVNHLESAYALLLKRCEAAEGLIEHADEWGLIGLPEKDCKECAAKRTAWLAAKAAH